MKFIKDKEHVVSALVHGVNENRLIETITNKENLKKEFISQEFSELITEPKLAFGEI